MIIDHQFIVFALEHYNPLGVIRTLGEYGIRPIYIAVKHRADLGVKSKYLSKCYMVESVEEGYEILLREYGEIKGKKPFLITCDDRTTGFLDERYEALKDRFFFFNAGEAKRITEYMDKKKILECAKRHGLKVLESVVVTRGEIPSGIEYPVITKSISPNVGGWKSDVHICHSEAELREAFEKIEAPTVLIQKYIEKKNEFCLDGFCANHGSLMFNAIASTYNYLIPGYYSPYMTVKGVDNPEMENSLNAMMKEIGFEGIYSIEFLIDQEDNYWFCEINFRNSTWSYAATAAGMPLAILWARTMLDGKLQEEGKVTFDSFTAMVEPVDFAKRVDSGKISFAEWLRDFKESKVTYYYNKEDPAPFETLFEHWDEYK